MKDYQQRVIDEKKQLDEKLVKLVAFLFSDASKGVSDEEKHAMQGQVRQMMNYSLTLERRIKLHALGQ